MGVYLPIGDPWREATHSADGNNFQSTLRQPIALSDGFHVSDLRFNNGLADSSIYEVQVQALASIKEWLAEWTPPVSKETRDEVEALVEEGYLPVLRFARDLEGMKQAVWLNLWNVTLF